LWGKSSDLKLGKGQSADGSSRYANRIKKGTFSIEGKTYHVPQNEHNGQNSLHGGNVGWDAVGSRAIHVNNQG
jgi:galactose mutarotase-like enzyme